MKKRVQIFNTFHFYIIKEVFPIFSLSALLFAFILVVGRIRQLTDLIINKGVEIKDIFLVLLYSSPPSLTFTLPMAFLLSTIVVLGRLSSENEILTLKTSGISLKKIYLPVFSFGLAITFFGLLNTFVLLPRSTELFKDTLIRVVKKGITVQDREGVFNDSIPGIVIYIDKVQLERGYFSGILVSDEREKNVRQIVAAKSGIINFDSSNLNLSFILKDGVIHRWEKEKDIYRNLSFKDYTFTIDLATLVPRGKPIKKKPYEMGISELKEILKREEDASKRYYLSLEIYKKISLPLSPLSFAFLAVPLGIRRKTEGKFAGAILSLLLFLAYYLLMGLADYAGGNFKFPPLFTAFIPNILFFLTGLYLTKGLDQDEHPGSFERLKRFFSSLYEKIR